MRRLGSSCFAGFLLGVLALVPAVTSAQGFQAVTTKDGTDVWAVGAVVYECITGRRPLEGHTVGQIMKSLATRDIPSIATLAALPPELAAAVDHMLRRDREERPPTLAPFLELSGRLLAHGLA